MCLACARDKISLLWKFVQFTSAFQGGTGLENSAFSQFGSHVFDDRAMRARLPQEVYQSLRRIRDEGEQWDPRVADVVADAMKNWAMQLGATHYIHWFIPLTGAGAGKHDSFIDGVREGEPITRFSGKMLVKGESDASSFPSGGLRATFEARGYTAWDPTSPAFVLGTTLYIPTAFCAYTGEALDQKTPLLRSIQALNRQALRVLRALDDSETVSVLPTVGAEQEYFLVDKELFDKRLDLKVCGRTLLGAKPPKGQELGDHYYGSISERVRAFMRELDDELWRIGVPAKTEHNEVAPAQHEMAPLFTTANLAIDANQLAMEVLKKVAHRHGFACLLHEKPFEGVNGSGKHNNWSLVTNTGKNLLKPGRTPEENPVFLVVLCAVLAAVDQYAALLRLAAACPGNEERLGGHEAPPAIVSVFLGDALTDVLREIAEGHRLKHAEYGEVLADVRSLPQVKRDNSDRNRTSPFAFTGNKFEFRMVGSKDSISACNVVLNTITAEAFKEACDVLESAEDFDLAVHDLIKEYATQHQRIVFNGNGYAPEWEKEARRRGLPVLPSMVDAIPALTTDKAVELFGEFGVFTKTELESRAEIQYEIYAKAINIEAKTMVDMATKQIIPAVIKYTTVLAESINQVKAVGPIDVSVQMDLLKKASKLLKEVNSTMNKLSKLVDQIETHPEGRDRAVFCREKLVPAMEKLREPVDELEMLVDKDMWPMPSYGDLVFEP